MNKQNKQSNQFLLIIIVVVVIIVVGTFAFKDRWIKKNLLYQSRSEEIPEQHLLDIYSSEELDTDLIYYDYENEEFYCKPSNKKARKVEYFSHSAGPEVRGGWYYRYALICGDKYWIVDGDSSYGENVYGPFRK